MLATGGLVAVDVGSFGVLELVVTVVEDFEIVEEINVDVTDLEVKMNVLRLLTTVV